MLYDLIGLAGVVMILFAYALLQGERAAHDDYSFLFLNIAGAGLVLASLIYAFNMAAFVLEAIWLSISLFGLARRAARDRH